MYAVNLYSFLKLGNEIKLMPEENMGNVKRVRMILKSKTLKNMFL